ncbi:MULTISPECIES: hypothetical protein [unclassified Bradyrhizobium]|uniref:hypothetical protein n=1 Tax=unclassified Bradyrhizobium TaxID=2631580 RepID=UPI0028E1C16F|nr:MULTISPECIES: hypothetical protein [unclassified Bradyrhizobium]
MTTAKDEISRFRYIDGSFKNEFEQEEEARKFASDQRMRWIIVIDQLISVGIFDSNLLAPYRDFVNTQSHEQFLVTQGRDGSYAVTSSLPLLGEMHLPQIHEDKWSWLAALLAWFSPFASINRPRFCTHKWIPLADGR